MPPDSKADLAHPEAADWVLGTMGPAQAEDFQRHLTDCLHCRAAVAEFGELGQMLQHLPPAAEPPPGLEARTIASVLAAAAKYPTPKADRRSDPEDQAATRVQPRPQLQPPAGDETRTSETQLQPPAGDETRPTRHEAAGHSPAGVAASPRPPGRCRCRRRCHHHRRHRRPAQPWRGPDHPGPSHSGDPAPCHDGGQADRRRSSHRASDGPSGRPKLDFRSDRAWPQAASRQRLL